MQFEWFRSIGTNCNRMGFSCWIVHKSAAAIRFPMMIFYSSYYLLHIDALAAIRGTVRWKTMLYDDDDDDE